MDALYGILEDIKSNAIPFVTGGAGVIAGLAVGKISHDYIAELLAPVDPKNEADAAKAAANATSMLRLYVAPLVPVALGIAAVVYGRGKVPGYAENAVEGLGLGLAAWGVGRLFQNATTKADGTRSADWMGKYLPSFSGVGSGSMADYYIRRAQALRGLGYGRCRPVGQRGSNIQCDPKLLPANARATYATPAAALDVASIPAPMQGMTSRSRRLRSA